MEKGMLPLVHPMLTLEQLMLNSCLCCCRCWFHSQWSFWNRLEAIVWAIRERQPHGQRQAIPTWTWRFSFLCRWLFQIEGSDMWRRAFLIEPHADAMIFSWSPNQWKSNNHQAIECTFNNAVITTGYDFHLVEIEEIVWRVTLRNSLQHTSFRFTKHGQHIVDKHVYFYHKFIDTISESSGSKQSR
jgi:hypothetical protein